MGSDGEPPHSFSQHYPLMHIQGFVRVKAGNRDCQCYLGVDSCTKRIALAYWRLSQIMAASSRRSVWQSAIPMIWSLILLLGDDSEAIYQNLELSMRKLRRINKTRNKESSKQSAIERAFRAFLVTGTRLLDMNLITLEGHECSNLHGQWHIEHTALCKAIRLVGLSNNT